MRLIIALLFSASAVLGVGEMVGRRAPGFSLPDASFRQHDPQDYRGRILIVELMQTTCPHCAAFSAILEQVTARYSGKVAVLSIVNPPDTPENVVRYTKAHNVHNPILFDCGQIAASYVQWTPQKPSSFSIPRVFIIDANGIIRRDFEYNLTTRDIFEGQGIFRELDQLLGSTPAPARRGK